MLPKVYVARVVMNPSDAPALSSWYKSRHAGDLIRTGFLSVHHHLVSEGAASVCNVYEIDNIDVFDDDYQASQDADSNLAKVASGSLPGSSQTIYRQLALDPPAASAGDDRPSLSTTFVAPVISLTAFGGEANDEDVVDAFVAACAGSDTPGRTRARLLALDDQQHPRPSIAPEDWRWAVLAEWCNTEGARSDASTLERAVLAGITSPAGARTEIFQRHLTVLHPDRWAV